MGRLDVAGHQNQCATPLIQIREVKKIIFLAELIVDIICVKSRLSTEENQHAFRSNRVSHMFAPRRQFLLALRILKHRCGWSNSEYGRRSLPPLLQKLTQPL